MARNLNSQTIPTYGHPALGVAKPPATYRHVRTDFTVAGQDSFTQPPAQDPELFQSCVDVLPPINGIIAPRWGVSGFNQGASATGGRLSHYRNIAGGYGVIIDSPLASGRNVIGLNEDGTVYNANIFAPVGANTRAIDSRDYMYFTSDNAADLKKWDGSAVGGSTKWGIDAPNAAVLVSPGAATGVAGPATGQQVANTSLQTQVSGSSWEFITFGAPQWRTKGGPNPAIGDLPYIYAHNFGLTVPVDATITGISVSFEASSQSTTSSYVDRVTLYNGSGQIGILKSVGPTVVIPVPLTWFGPYGGSLDTWGLGPTTTPALSPALVNDSAFGFAVQIFYAQNGSGQRVFLYSFRISVDYTLEGLNLTAGRTYFMVYENSVSGHYSDLGTASVSTGALTGQDVNLNALPVSADPQVDKKVILATADGNDQTTLYEVAEIANAVTTYTDTLSEFDLLNQNIFQETDDFGIEHGVVGNDPPPQFQFPTKHLGRVFAAKGEFVYFSKALSELTTSTGLIVGKYEESFPPEHVLDISQRAEAVTGLLSDGQSLYIGTNSHVRRLSGTTAEEFSVPEILFNDVGVGNNDTWKVIFLEGAPVGAMWLTPDKRIIGSDFNTYEDIGRPIQDVLNTIDIASASSMYMTLRGITLYVLSTRASLAGGREVFAYNIQHKRWFVWTSPEWNGSTYHAELTSFFHDIGVSGVELNLLKATDGDILKFDPASTIDDPDSGSRSVLPVLKTSWLDLGDPVSAKALNEIDVATTDTAMTISVWGANTAADFAAPVLLLNAGTLVTSPLGMLKHFLAGLPTKYRWYQFQFTFLTANKTLNGYSLEVIPLHRI